MGGRWLLERAGKVSEQRDDVVQQIGCVSGGVAVREQHFGQVVAKATTGDRAVGRARGAEGVTDVGDVGIAVIGGRGAVSAQGGGDVVAAEQRRAGAAGNGNVLGAASVDDGGEVTVAVLGLGRAEAADDRGGVKVAGAGLGRAVGAEGGGGVEAAVLGAARPDPRQM